MLDEFYLGIDYGHKKLIMMTYLLLLSCKAGLMKILWTR